MKIIKCWTDGACFPNPGRGGWGWTTLDGNEGSGGLIKTTNQVMELTATIEAIRTLYEPGATIEIITDSQYVIKGVTVWSKTWLKNGWRNSKGQPVANRDLWEELIRICAGRNILFRWVKGHSGDPGNEEADRLATVASGANIELINKCKKNWHGEERANV